MELKKSNIAFLSGDYGLKGTLHLPAEETRAVVIGSHGLYADSDSPKQVALAEKCAGSGIAYFRFDHRGCGNSQGKLQLGSCLKDRRIDLLCAVKAVKKEMGDDIRVALFGSSMGGTVCLHTAKEISPVSMVTVAAPVISRTISTGDDPSQQALAFDITHRLDTVNNILIFHGDADEVVPVSNSDLILKHARQDKKRIILPGGDHRMSDKTHQERFILESVKWFGRFFGTRSRI